MQEAPNVDTCERVDSAITLKEELWMAWLAQGFHALRQGRRG